MKCHWEDDVSVVIETKGNVVYKVRKEKDPKAKPRVLHMNLLMPCDDFLDRFDLELEEKYLDKRSKISKKKKTLPKKTNNHNIQEDDSSSEEEMLTPNQTKLSTQLGCTSKLLGS